MEQEDVVPVVPGDGTDRVVTHRQQEEAGLGQLVGLEVSAVCFVRDYVELHFDGPVLRAVSNPFGLYGCQGRRFPEGNSPTVMRYYIGKTVDGVELVPDRLLALDCSEHRFAIPLDQACRVGPEAVHLLMPDTARHMWIW